VAALAATEPHRAALILVAVHGARPHMVRNLRPNDVDLVRCRLTLNGVTRELDDLGHEVLSELFRDSGVTLDRLRMDRNLEEALSYGADHLHLAALFGISDATAIRCTHQARLLLASPQLRARRKRIPSGARPARPSRIGARHAALARSGPRSASLRTSQSACRRRTRLTLQAWL